MIFFGNFFNVFKSPNIFMQTASASIGECVPSIFFYTTSLVLKGVHFTKNVPHTNNNNKWFIKRKTEHNVIVLKFCYERTFSPPPPLPELDWWGGYGKQTNRLYTCLLSLYKEESTWTRNRLCCVWDEYEIVCVEILHRFLSLFGWWGWLLMMRYWWWSFACEDPKHREVELKPNDN